MKLTLIEGAFRMLLEWGIAFSPVDGRPHPVSVSMIIPTAFRSSKNQCEKLLHFKFLDSSHWTKKCPEIGDFKCSHN